MIENLHPIYSTNGITSYLEDIYCFTNDQKGRVNDKNRDVKKPKNSIFLKFQR